LIEHRVSLGGREFSVLAAPGREPELTAETDPDRIPYWTVLWDSSRALAQWLLHHPDRWTGPVLELGCGVGLAGLAAASTGAKVLQTDLFPEALRAARENAARNKLHLHQVAADWSHWALQDRFSTIIAADILYERASHGHLIKVFETALVPEGAIYLTDPNRPMLASFLDLAQHAGWEISEIDVGWRGKSEIRLLALRFGESTRPEHSVQRGR
jgi:predicted nicotinamide N-methyase